MLRGMFNKPASLLILALTCILVTSAHAQSITETRATWENARLTSETAPLSTILADNFSAILEDGQQLDKNAFLNLLRTGHPGLTSASSSETDLRTFDGVILANGALRSSQKQTTTEWVRETRRATGRTFMREVEVEGMVEVKLLFTEVWLQIDGRWQLAALQLTNEK